MTELVVAEPEVKHSIYIFKCTDSVVQVKSKVNHITLDGCKKTAVVFDSVMAGIDLINCSGCTVQVFEGPQPHGQCASNKAAI